MTVKLSCVSFNPNLVPIYSYTEWNRWRVQKGKTVRRIKYKKMHVFSRNFIFSCASGVSAQCVKREHLVAWRKHKDTGDVEFELFHR